MTILRRSLLLGTSLCSAYFIYGVPVPWAAPEEAAPGGDRDTNAEKGDGSTDERETDRRDSGDRSDRAGPREGTEASQRRAGDTKADSLGDDKLANDDLKSSELKQNWQDNNLFPAPTKQVIQVEPGWFQFNIFGPANAQTGPINSSDGMRQTLTVFGGAVPLGREARGYELEASSFYITDSRGSITESGLAVGVSNPVHSFMEVYVGRMAGGEIAAGVLIGSSQGNASVGVGYGVQFGFREDALTAGSQGAMGPTERAIIVTLSRAGLPAF